MNSFLEDIIDKYEREIRDRMEKLDIILFGSYRTNGNSPIEEIKKELLKRGLKCRLCKDLSIPPSPSTGDSYDNFEKSVFCLEKADVNVLVFFLGVDNAGVQTEALHILNEKPKLIQKSIFVIERDELKEYTGATSLLYHFLGNHRITAINFTDRKRAADIIIVELRKFVRTKRY